MENSRQVDLRHTFDFPIAVVFDAWVNPVHLMQWFAPHGCTLSFRKLDIREGGSFHSCVHTPAFGDCWCIGTYLEIIPERKIVFTMINADEHGKPVDPAQAGMDPEWPGATTVTVTFSGANGKTTINLKQTVSESLAKKTGAYHGWVQMFERLQTAVAAFA